MEDFLPRFSRITCLLVLSHTRCPHWSPIHWFFFPFKTNYFVSEFRQRKILENRSLQDEERMDALENQLKEARFLAEDSDKKYDEVRKRHGFLT